MANLKIETDFPTGISKKNGMVTILSFCIGENQNED